MLFSNELDTNPLTGMVNNKIINKCIQNHMSDISVELYESLKYIYNIEAYILLYDLIFTGKLGVINEYNADTYTSLKIILNSGNV